MPVSEFIVQAILLVIMCIVLWVAANAIIIAHRNWLRNRKPSGALKVDRSDPDGPYIFLELYTDLPKLCDKKHVILEVKLSDYLSHK